MKRTIEWHKECLNNQKATLTRAKHILKLEEEDVARLTTEVLLYDEQIKEAVRRGIDGFDRDRFLQKRGGKRSEEKEA